MALIWLTGVPGAGKSAVARLLRARGLSTRDADEDGYREWRSKETREFVSLGDAPLDRSGFTLDLVPERVERLRAECAQGVCVLAGHVPNESECLPLFDAVVALQVDDATLLSRLAARPGRSFGKTPEVQRVILGWNAAAPAKYVSMDAFVVDGTKAIEEVAAEVARFCEAFVIPP